MIRIPNQPKTRAPKNVYNPTRKPKAAKPKPLSEAHISEQIVDYMRLLGYRANRQNVGQAKYGERGRVSYGEKGCPDFIFVHPTQPAVYIEVKAEDKRIRPSRELIAAIVSSPKDKALKHEFEQSTFIENLKRGCFRAFWANSLEMAKREMGRAL